MKCCIGRRFLIISTTVNIVCAVVVIYLLLLYYFLLPRKCQIIIDEMRSQFQETQFHTWMHPLTENNGVAIFSSDVDIKDAPLAIMITICDCNYLLYYDGRNYIYLYENISKYGWRIGLTDYEPFRMLDNVASKFLCERCVQYTTTGDGDAPEGERP